MHENDAALIIQKCVRKYAEKVHANEERRKELNDREVASKMVLDEVNSFYQKLHSNLRKKEEIRTLCANIDEVSEQLMAMKRLEGCREIETSFCDNARRDRVRELHLQQLKKMNLKWWEKLDICDD